MPDTPKSFPRSSYSTLLASNRRCTVWWHSDSEGTRIEVEIHYRRRWWPWRVRTETLTVVKLPRGYHPLMDKEAIDD